MTIAAAFALLARIEAAGHAVRAEGGVLLVSDGRKLPAGDADLVRRLKPILLALVREPEPGEALSGWDDESLYCPHQMRRMVEQVEAYNAAALLVKRKVRR